jgi:uncharacterized damage-inducible protein DinB
MSRIITQSLEGNIMRAFSLANEFVKVCPEDIWGMKFGGWPVWQQIFHPFASLDFFLRAADEHPESPLFEPGVAELKKTLLEPPAKLLIKEYVEKAQERVREYIAGLDDTALAAKHEGLSARFGRDMTQASALGLIAAHTMYHLGACDAALREQGLPGVF